MTLPHVEPMSRGAMPTADGFYVVGYLEADRSPFVVYVRDSAYDDDPAPEWMVEYIGNDNPYVLNDQMQKDGLFFIARIYPDRIAARAKALSDLAALNGELL